MHVGSARPRNLLSSCARKARVLRRRPLPGRPALRVSPLACIVQSQQPCSTATTTTKLNKYALLVTTVVTDALYVAWPHACVLQSMRVLLRRFDPVPLLLRPSGRQGMRTVQIY